MSTKKFCAPVVLAAAFLSIAGCNTKFERPPLECGYRPSLVGAGNILRLENRSNAILSDLAIEIRTGDGEVSYEESEIGGYQVLEIGWKKLGGFEIPDDAKVEIRAGGYLLPLRCELSASADNGKTRSR